MNAAAASGGARRTTAAVAIIGGGVYVPRLVVGLASAVRLPRVRVRIAGRRPDRVRVIAAHAERSARRLAPTWDVRATSSIEDAVRGADVVVLLARIGGLAAREHDETFPRALGRPGDEGLGLGGLANAWRTLPVLEGIGRTIRERAPAARVLNLMGPLPATTRLLRELGLDAVGLCELPVTVERALRPETALEYIGTNHLGWFWPAKPAGRGALARLVARGLAHERTVRRYGAVPLPYYYRVVRHDLGEELGITPPAGRAAALIDLSERIFRRMADGAPADEADDGARPTPWFDDALIPVVRAFLGGGEHHGYVATVIAAPLLRLPAGTVLETRAVFDGSGVSIRMPGQVPRPVRRFVEGAGSADDRVYRACRSRALPDLERAVRSVAGIARDRLNEAVREVCRFADAQPVESPLADVVPS